ncbi:MAG: hypothetical protein IJM81_07425, partial [Prevotella sp.]|nr:hypothetical protein [Prevotella sp.]
MKNFLRYSLLLLLAVFAGNKGFATDVVFDFSTAEGIAALGIDVPAENTNVDIAGKTIVFQNITMTATDGPNVNSTRVWQSSGNSAGKYDLRAYNGATLTFTAPTNKVITKMVCTDSFSKKWDSAPSANVGTFSDHTWTGSANSVTLTMNAQNRFGTITITYGDDDGTGGGVTPDPDPDPNPDGTVTFDFDKDNDVLALFGFEGYSSGSGASYVDTGDFKEDKTGTVEGVDLTVSPNPTEGGTPNRVWGSSPKLRLYGGSFTVKAPAGHKITAMTFTTSWNSNNKALQWNATASTGTLTVGDMSNQTVVWAGEAEEVVFTVEKNT